MDNFSPHFMHFFPEISRFFVGNFHHRQKIPIFDQNFNFPSKLGFSVYALRYDKNYLEETWSLIVFLVDNFRKFPKQWQNVTIWW